MKSRDEKMMENVEMKRMEEKETLENDLKALSQKRENCALYC